MFTQAILDDFNRANENPLNPTNWEARSSNPLKLVSNKATGTNSGDFNFGVWLPGGAISGDVEAYCTLGTRDSWSRIAARVQAGTSSTPEVGYAVSSNANGSLNLEILNGVGLAAGTVALSPGDKIGIRCIGSSIQAWTWTAAGGWVSQFAVTNTTYSSGMLGLGQGLATGTIDDFAGGSTVTAPAFVPQIIWFTPAAPTTAPAAPTYASSIAYATVANRPAATGTTRPFASSAALTGALNAAAPGDLVQYTGAGILDIPSSYTGFCGRRYAGYVNIDLGLKSSANHVRFPGGTAGSPAVYIYNAQYLRIYGGEITNTALGTDGLEVNAAGVPHDGSTNHITWWNLVVHDTRSDGIRMLPSLAFSGSGPTGADLTIADCDIEAEVYNVCLDKSLDTSHIELGTGQHCCLLADTDPVGATYPSFLRNRVAINGYNTGLVANQGGGSVIELGFNDAASTISGCTLILTGNNTMFNAQQQTGGNGLNLWGDASINCTVQYMQHSNATGSAVLNYPPGYNRSGVTVQYGRHTRTNLNAFEGTQPWQIGPTYRDIA